MESPNEHRRKKNVASQSCTQEGHRMSVTHDQDKAVLYLLKNNFTDPAYPGETFFCPHCLRMEGLLALFPAVRQNINVCYVDFAKPRGALPNFAGIDNQSCPQLIFPRGDDTHSPKFSTGGLSETRRIVSTQDILDYFIERFELPNIHP